MTALPDDAELRCTMPAPGSDPLTDTHHRILRDSMKRKAAEANRDVDWTTYRIDQYNGDITDASGTVIYTGRYMRATVTTHPQTANA